MLLLLIYVAKKDQNLTFTKLYLTFLLIAFGITVGTISMICAVDVPNVGYRATLLWVVGAMTVAVGVIGAILSILFVAKSYGAPGLGKLDNLFKDKKIE